MTLPPDRPEDDGPTIPARFRVYPEPSPAPSARMLVAVGLWVGLVLTLIAGGFVVASWT